mgnify:CR=1 FL=1|tara:strand:- start:5958 stop:6704 length:747 start_codon:yes stop_codon:yes gene_type:complete
MGVGIAMGAAAIGMGVMGAISANDAASAENAARTAQYVHQTSRETWQYGEASWATAQQNANRWMQNQVNMEAAARNYGLNQIALAKTTEARRKQISRAQKTQTASVTSSLNSKVGLNSGTAERILKQMELQGAENWSNEFKTKLNSQRQLKQQYDNNIRQGSDLGYNVLGPYQPGLPPQMQNVGMATMMGGIQGAAQGIQMVGGIMGAMNSYQQWSAGGAGGGGDLGTLGNAAASDSTGDAYMAAMGF